MNEQILSDKRISFLIPAYNEEDSISGVVRVALSHPLGGEVIVIDDGSTDLTAQRAQQAGATVHMISGNQGKGEAMSRGAKLARYGYFCFLDADIKGLDKIKLDRIILPVLSGSFDMYIAIRDRRVKWLNRILRFFPLIGGERAMTRKLWEEVPADYKKDFQIEIALNYFAKKNGRKTGFSHIPGLTHSTKEKKRGFFQGFIDRQKMSADIVSAAWRLYVKESLFKGRWKIFRPGPKFGNYRYQ